MERIYFIILKKKGLIMTNEDINADIEMSFRQIISLADLMLECNNEIIPNILTIRDLAEAGLCKFQEIGA